jgi:hypothetical protein
MRCGLTLGAVTTVGVLRVSFESIALGFSVTGVIIVRNIPATPSLERRDLRLSDANTGGFFIECPR